MITEKAKKTKPLYMVQKPKVEPESDKVKGDGRKYVVPKRNLEYFKTNYEGQVMQ